MRNSPFVRFGLYLALLALIASPLGCDLLPFSKEEEEDRKRPKAQIEEFMGRFEEAGKARGIDVSNPEADVLRPIDSVIVVTRSQLQFDGREYCGYVPQKGYGYTDSILISVKEDCWFGVSDHVREALVFHELGHSVLGRVHRDERLPNGSPASIMFPETGFGARVYGEETLHRRTYYLDELFDPETPVPDWAEDSS